MVFSLSVRWLTYILKIQLTIRRNRFNYLSCSTRITCPSSFQLFGSCSKSKFHNSGYSLDTNSSFKCCKVNFFFLQLKAQKLLPILLYVWKIDTFEIYAANVFLSFINLFWALNCKSMDFEKKKCRQKRESALIDSF